MDIINIVLFTVCTLFLIFALHLLFAKKGKRTLSWFLSFVLFARIGQMAIFLSVYNQLAVFPWLYKLFTPLYYIMPAALYLYITRILGNWHKKDYKFYLHFLPFVIVAIHFLPFRMGESINWTQVAIQIKNETQIFIRERTGLFPPAFLAFFRIILITGYLIAGWIAFIKSDVFKQKSWSGAKLWLCFLLTASTLVTLIALVPVWTLHETGAYSWFIPVNCGLLVLVLLYILHKPNLLYRYLLINVSVREERGARVREEKTAKMLPEVCRQPARRKELEEMMCAKQLYLNPDLQIKDLANGMGLPVHQCSAMINYEMGKSFRDWINAYRVARFIEVYPEKKTVQTIETMANEAGFKNMTTFYKAFKKETNLMPTQYFR